MSFFNSLKKLNPLYLYRCASNKIKNSQKIPKELKIFFVEDEAYYLKLMKANLNKMGFNDIKGFTSGEELLLHLENGEKPNVIIMDYIIKNGMNAFEILTEIKKYKLDSSIIILSGQSGVEKAAMIIKNGATDYIVKNNMAFFNLENTLLKIKKAHNSKIEDNIKNKKIRTFYQIGIVAIWIVLVIVLFSKIKTGI